MLMLTTALAAPSHQLLRSGQCLPQGFVAPLNMYCFRNVIDSLMDCCIAQHICINLQAGCTTAQISYGMDGKGHSCMAVSSDILEIVMP